MFKRKLHIFYKMSEKAHGSGTLLFSRDFT